MALRQRALDMRRHVIGALGDMPIKGNLFWCAGGEEILQISQDILIEVLLDKQRGGGMAEKKRQKTSRNALSVKPVDDDASDFVKALARRGHGEAILAECSVSKLCCHRTRIP